MQSAGTLREWSDESYFSVDYSVNEEQNTVSRKVRRSDGEVIETVVGLSTLPSASPLEAFDIGFLLSKEKPPKSSHNRGTLHVCDLFSGCGGISVGVEEAARSLGFDTEFVLGWDIMEEARLAFDENFSPRLLRGDPIEEVIDGELGAPLTPSEAEFIELLGDVDMVVGGPPCQGHSDLNNHSRRDDPKNDLYLRMTRFIEITRPRFAIIENVLTVRRSKGMVTQITDEFLGGLGYNIQQDRFKAIDIGVAQDRRRHFTVAIRDADVPPGIFDVKRVEESRPVLWPLRDLGETDPNSTFNYPSTHQPQNKERIAWLFGEGWTEDEIEDEEYNFGTKDKPFSYNLINHRRPRCHQNGHNYPAVYGRMFPNLPAPTMTCGFGSTGQGRFVHPNYPRTLTPHEVARLQTFPDYFVFSEVIKRRAMHMLIGNAVPPMVAEHITRIMLSTIE